MMKNFKKSGFTLMELLVYMAIVGIVVVIAGEAFSNSTKFRVRTDNMIRSTQEAENAAMLFREDVSQMGAKNSVESGNCIAFYYAFLLVVFLFHLVGVPSFVIAYARIYVDVFQKTQTHVGAELVVHTVLPVLCET